MWTKFGPDLKIAGAKHDVLDLRSATDNGPSKSCSKQACPKLVSASFVSSLLDATRQLMILDSVGLLPTDVVLALL